MLQPKELTKLLCKTFCGAVSVHPVATGYAISSAFKDSSGDRIDFYLTPADDGYRLEDDGSYLAHLIAKDIPIDQGTRGQLLEAILRTADASWDRESLEIRTEVFHEAEVAGRVIDFLSGMMRVRDLELLTRDAIRSTFREDAIAAISNAVSHAAVLKENEVIGNEFKEFPADIIVHPNPNISKAKSGAIYLVNSNDKMNEALLLKMEAEKLNRTDFEVIALVEGLSQISLKRFQRAQNRDVAIPIFRDDEEAAANFIRRRLLIPPRIAA